MPNTRLDLNHQRIPSGIIRKADVLMEALPYLQAFRGKTFVIKYGGSALSNPIKRRRILQDIVFLSVSGIRPVLVHGAGLEISKRMSGRGTRPRFVQGLRVTDAQTLRVVSQTLAQVNQQLVRELKALGARAQEVHGAQAGLLRAEKFSSTQEDLGFVGTITSVNCGPIQRLLVMGVIPVVIPMGIGWDNQSYNINADEAAASLAAGLKAEKFVLVTDVPGILKRPSDRGSLISSVTIKAAQQLIRQGVVLGGMIPKTLACIKALKGGVRKTHMIQVDVPHGLLLEIFTDRGVGTEIIA